MRGEEEEEGGSISQCDVHVQEHVKFCYFVDQLLLQWIIKIPRAVLCKQFSRPAAVKIVLFQVS